MCKFEIEYFYEGGNEAVRTGVVFAKNLSGAVEKIERIDDEYSGVSAVRFKEIPGWKPDYKAEK
ncbi:MAG: hypothetical protein IJ043_03295 [Clostridia bacterium]|nr:hypothetical protein [Clostridia bacterium]